MRGIIQTAIVGIAEVMRIIYFFGVIFRAIVGAITGVLIYR